LPVPTNPMKIPGSWKEGYVLDYHTKSSEFIGYGPSGRAQFDTVYTPVGELLYAFKYKEKKAALDELVTVAADFIRKRWRVTISGVVPVPASKPRPAQPVLQIAKDLAKALDVPLHDVVRKATSAKQLKDVTDYAERLKLLEGAHTVGSVALRGKSVLLVDDLYRSGATLNAVTAVLSSQGGARDVYAFCMTRTRKS
jgi:competence protein ComFC